MIFKSYDQATIRKDKRVNIRISEHDPNDKRMSNAQICRSSKPGPLEYRRIFQKIAVAICNILLYIATKMR
jgi:predicted DNA binding CopG/RHH family protein